MANIDRLSRLANLVNILRGGSQREREFETPLGQMKNQLDLENVALRNVEIRRKLSEPTEWQQEQIKQQGEQQKYIFSTLKDLALDVRIPQATRDYYNSMMRAQYYSLTPEMQNILTPLLENSPLDANTQKVEFFEKYGEQPPMEPYSTQGDKIEPLPRTQENARRWAEYDISSSEYQYRRNLFLFGDRYAESQKPPMFYQPVEWVGEGEKRQPGDFWYRDPQTRQITNIPSSIAEVSMKDLENMGWTLPRVKSTGVMPIGGTEPIIATVGGSKVQITPVKDLITGEEKYNIENFGSDDSVVKKLPPKVLTALGELGRGTDYTDPKEVRDGEVANIMQILTEFESAYGKIPTQEQLNGLNSRLQAYYPEMLGNRLVRIPKDKQGFMRRILRIPGTEWSIIPVTATRNVIDRTGTPGTVFVDEGSGRTFAADGTEIMQNNVKEGDTVSSIQFRPEIIGKQWSIKTQQPIEGEIDPELLELNKKPDEFAQAIGNFFYAIYGTSIKERMASASESEKAYQERIEKANKWSEETAAEIRESVKKLYASTEKRQYLTSLTNKIGKVTLTKQELKDLNEYLQQLAQSHNYGD